VHSRAPPEKKQYKGKPWPQRRPGQKPGKEQTRQTASGGVSQLLHSLRGYCRVPQLGVPKLRWKTTRKKTKNKPSANLLRLRGKINLWAKLSLAGPLARHVNKPSHLPASSEASHRGGSRNTFDSPEASALGLGHRPTYDNIVVSSEPQKMALSVSASPKTSL
jgi:hypothetical protein